MAYRLQWWDAAGQTINQAGTQTYSSADRLLKVFLSTALPIRGKRHSSTHQWAETSHNWQEAYTNLLDSLIHQRADRRSKNYNRTVARTKPTITES